MAKIKKAQKGGCLSTTGSGTRTSIYKSAAGEGGSGSDRRAARQFARNERKMDKAAAKLEREEAKAAAKAPKGKSGLKVKKAQSGTAIDSYKKAPKKSAVALTEMGKKTTKAAIDKRTSDMAKSYDKASAFGKNYVAPGKKKAVPKKKMGGKCKYGC